MSKRKIVFFEKSFSVHLHPFVRIAHIIKKFHEVGASNGERCGVDARMKTYSVVLLQILVEKHMHMVFFVVYQSERGDGAGCDAKIFHHPFGRSETQFPLVQLFFNGMNVHVAVAVKQYQIMLIALVVPEKQILAVFGIGAHPKLFRYGNGRGGGMFGIFIFYAEPIEQRV